MTKPVYIKRLFLSGESPLLTLTTVYKWTENSWSFRLHSKPNQWSRLPHRALNETIGVLDKAREKGSARIQVTKPESNEFYKYEFHRISKEEATMILFETKR